MLELQEPGYPDTLQKRATYFLELLHERETYFYLV